MSAQKFCVAEPKQYPPIIPGYYALAFKKDKKDRLELKEAKRNHKALINAEFGNQFTASQRKKIMNPTRIRLAD